MIGRIILGFIITGVGFVIVWQTQWFLQNLGRMPFFEKWLSWIGGTWMAYKIIGVLCCLMGSLTIVGLQDNFLTWILGTFFGPAFPGINNKSLQ